MKSLSMDDVSVKFGALRALQGVSLKVGGGETLLLAGPNGSGKSTLIRVLLGLVRPSTGSVLVDGRPRPVDNTFKQRLGYLPEAVAFAENLTGFQVMRFFARARGVGKDRARDVLKRVGLEGAAGRAVRGYSRGMRQRLGLGVAIVGAPELLVLDEPTGGLDQEGITVLWGVLEEWREKARCVIVASHDLSLLERRVDSVCLLKAGQVLACDSPTRLRERAAVPVTVHLAPSREATLAEIADRVKKGGRGHVVTVEKDSVKAQIEPEGLLSFLDLWTECPGLLAAIRVEEPGLDAVYDRLLEEAAQ